MAAVSPERGSSFVYFLFGLLLGAGLTYLLLFDGNNLLSFTPSESTPRLPTIAPDSPADSPIRPTSRPLTARPPSPTRAPPSPPTTGAPVIAGDERLLERMRLPTGIRPSHYDLTIQVFLPEYKTQFDERLNYVFNGSVAVNFTSSLPFKTVVLNQKDLSFERNLSLYPLRSAATKERINPIELRLDNDFDFITFEFEKQLPAGEYTLQIPFDGKMRQPFGKLYTNGLYGSPYVGRDGRIQVAAATQFEPYDARRMVPCFDEPDYKASWRVEIIHPLNSTALSNQIEKATSQLGDWQATEFETTPVMSSYLLAIAVMDYEMREQLTESGIRVRVWSPPKDFYKTEWALKAAVTVIEGFEKHFKIRFPMNKCDHITFKDFSAGAMENWGLITYSQTAFYHDPKVHTLNMKRSVASTISHELAHMWFGNLVTMRWWSNLWLNEGFATFAEVIGLDMIDQGAFEGERIRTDQLMYKALDYDQKREKGYPMSYNVTLDWEIMQMFGPNSYKKGASFINMLRKILGEELFYKGIENYLRRYSYSNSWETDLFREFDQLISEDFRYSDPAGKGIRFNVTKFGIRWTRQKGSPIVTLQPVNKTHLEITQRRFYLLDQGEDHPRFSPNPYGYKWDVPIWLVRGDGRKEFHWLPADSRLFVETSSPNEAIVLNEDSIAIARTNYSLDGWRALFEQFKTNHTVFSTRTRYRFISDLLLLTTMDEIPIIEVIQTLANYLVKEDDKMPWEPVLSTFKHTYQHLFGTDLRSPPGYFMYALIAARKQKINIEKMYLQLGQNDAELRQNMLAISLYKTKCVIHPDDCQKDLEPAFLRDFTSKCSEKSDQPASSCSLVPVWIKEEVYCAGLAVHQDDDKITGRVVELLRRETESPERSRLALGLGCTGNLSFLEQVGDDLSKDDSKLMATSLANSERGRDYMGALLEVELKKYPNPFLKQIAAVLDLLTENIRDMVSIRRLETALSEARIDDSEIRRQFVQTIEKLKKRFNFVTSTPAGQLISQVFNHLASQLVEGLLVFEK